MQISQIDIQQGRIKHFLYKSKVRSALYGSSADETFFAQGGPMGDWINRIGNVKYGHLAEMKQLSRINKELASHVDQLIFSYKRGRIQEAKDGLAKVDKYSEEILALLDAMEKMR